MSVKLLVNVHLSQVRHWMCIITTVYIGFIGIYLINKGKCYPNGSYVFDVDLRYSNLDCVLPGSTLNGGEWVTPSRSSVDCSTNPLRCNVVSSPNASIGLYIAGGNISPSNDGWYKCCLPTDCSNPNTNIIFANIFSKCFQYAIHHVCNHLLLMYRMGTN